MLDWKERARSFEEIGLGRGWPFNLKGDDGVEGVRGGLASGALFDVFGVRPALGRLIGAPDLPPGNDAVAVLSYSFFVSYFGEDPGVLGQEIVLSDRSYTVIGVLPAGLDVPELQGIELWTPLHFDPRDETQRRWRGFATYGRLRENTSLDEARVEMETIAGRLAALYPETNQGWRVRIVPLRDQVVGSARGTLLLFLAAVGLVWLITCANVGNVLLARSIQRRRELAVRASLGAGRGRLAAMLLTEGLILSVVGGMAGILLAYWQCPSSFHWHRRGFRGSTRSRWICASWVWPRS